MFDDTLDTPANSLIRLKYNKQIYSNLSFTERLDRKGYRDFEGGWIIIFSGGR